MKNVFLAFCALASATSHAAEEKVCAAITHCDTVLTTKSAHKKGTFKNTLRFDELCGKDEHSLPLKGGQEVELKIVKTKVQAILRSAGQGAVLATKSGGLKSEHLTLKYKGKDESTTVTCSK